MAESTQIAANETLRQLGGTGRLKAMIGATNFFHENDGRTLRFHFAMCKTAKVVTITLNGLDLYDVKFIKPGRLSRKTFTISPAKVTGEFENVYADDLKSLFEEFTGLRLSL